MISPGVLGLPGDPLPSFPHQLISLFMGSAGVLQMLESVAVTEQEMMDGGIVCYGGRSHVTVSL